MKPQNPDSKIDKMFLSFLSWREKYVGERTFVIFLALLVGIFCGFAATVLKFLIHTISSLLLSSNIDRFSLSRIGWNITLKRFGKTPKR